MKYKQFVLKYHRSTNKFLTAKEIIHFYIGKNFVERKD